MDNTISKSKSKTYETLLRKLPIALVGVILVGFGIAFNAAGMLGNDSVSVLYDGVRNGFGLHQDNLGLVTNLVNLSFLAVVFIFNRKYINIGTFIYALPLGNFISIGFKLYEVLDLPTTLGGRAATSFLGCTMLFLGVGIYIAMDIGIGFVLGGKVGAVTVIAAFTAGPAIQKISEVFDKKVLAKMNLSKTDREQPFDEVA